MGGRIADSGRDQGLCPARGSEPGRCRLSEDAPERESP
jgi:hypothetical protein